MSFVMNKLIILGYEVYVPFGSGASCDLIAVKDNKTQRVEVETSSKLHKSGAPVFDLRSNRNGVNYFFDSTKSDLLACFSVPLEMVILTPSYLYHGRGVVPMPL